MVFVKELKIEKGKISQIMDFLKSKNPINNQQKKEDEELSKLE